MRIIPLKILHDFTARHANAAAPLTHWSKVITASDFSDFNALKRVFRSADLVAPFTVFNVGGNNFRVIARVDYRTHTVFLSSVLTHAEYDKWNKLRRKGKV